MAPDTNDRTVIEARFAGVFSHLGLVTAYARRRGAGDPEEIAAEVMAIAWRRLADVPDDDPRPWLIATARNLVLADWRRRGQRPMQGPGAVETFASAAELPPELPRPGDLPGPTVELDPELERALAALSARDREALLLIAWDDLTPKAAAASLGISAAAFRVRLHRARRRLVDELETGAHRETLDNCRPSLERL